MNDKEIGGLITLALITWPNQPDIPLAQRIYAWRDYFGDLDETVVHAAIVQLGCEGDRFPPPPGLIRKRAFALVNPAGAAPGPDEAWQEIKQMIAKVGWTSALDTCHVCVRLSPQQRIECEHHWVTFTHPAIQAFVDGMGWAYLCKSEDEMADRAHFVKWYPSAVERLANQAALPQLVRELTSQVSSAFALERGE